MIAKKRARRAQSTSTCSMRPAILSVSVQIVADREYLFSGSGCRAATTPPRAAAERFARTAQFARSLCAAGRGATRRSATSSTSLNRYGRDDFAERGSVSRSTLRATAALEMSKRLAARKAPAGHRRVVFGRRFALSAQPHFLSLSSSKKEERAGERRRFSSVSPLSDSLPARSSQGERGKTAQAVRLANTTGHRPALLWLQLRRRGRQRSQGHANLMQR
jgi:hypothetical protein